MYSKMCFMQNKRIHNRDAQNSVQMKSKDRELYGLPLNLA